MSLKTAVMLGSIMIALGSSALAAAGDYRFEAVTKQVGVAQNVPITVRLIHVPSSKPVIDAIILPARLEMMMGSAPMVAPVRPQGSDGKGGYILVSDVSMEGAWTLKLAAKAQGEPETITGSVSIMAGRPGIHSGH